MIGMPSAGVQIRLAEGGYIVQWMESRKAQAQKGEDYLEQERQAMGGCIPRHYLGMAKYKVAVRVNLEDALKLAGEILAKMRETGVEEDDGPDSFMAGA